MQSDVAKAQSPLKIETTLPISSAPLHRGELSQLPRHFTTDVVSCHPFFHKEGDTEETNATAKQKKGNSQSLTLSNGERRQKRGTWKKKKVSGRFY